MGFSKNRLGGSLKAKIADWVPRHGDFFCVLFLYTLFTILFTWPLGANFASFLDGNARDVWHEIWYMHLASTMPYGPFFFFFTSQTFLPTGAPLYFQVVSPFNSLIFSGLYPLFGPVVTYNILFILAYVLSGLTTYILVKYLTHNKYAAFFAGLAFTFAPIHLSQGLSHLNIISVEFLPLFGYYLLKMIRERQLKNAIYAGIAIVLNAMADLDFVLLAGAILGLFLIYYLVISRKDVFNKPFLIRLTIMASIAAILGIGIYFQTLYGLLFVPKGLGATASLEPFQAARSNDLLSFFLPAPENTFLGALTYSHYLSFNPITSVPRGIVRAYIGVTVGLLALGGLAVRRRSKEVIGWAIIAAFGFLVSLGPFITIGGKPTPVVGLWEWLYYIIPLVSSFRAPNRFDYLVALSLAVLAGYGVAALMSYIDSSVRKKSLSTAIKTFSLAILILFLVFEFITIPFPMFSTQTPQIYKIMASDTSNYTVLEVPLVSANSIYLYYQLTYNHPLINGQIPRLPRYPLSFADTTPFINELGPHTPNNVPKQLVNETFSVTQLGPYILSQFNIKYVVLHKNLNLQPDQYQLYSNLITQALGAPFYQDSTIVAWKVDSPSGTGIVQFLQNSPNMTQVSLLTGGWFPYGLYGNGRAFDIFGGLAVYSSMDQLMQLKFRVAGVTASYPIQLSVNGEIVATYFAKEGSYSIYSTPFFPIQEGINQVQFNSPNGCTTVRTPNPFVPSTTSGKATNCVSVTFSWIDPVTAQTVIQK